MGELKKKKVDYVAKTDDGEEILIESSEMSTDEQTIELLRTYMKKFYEMQIEKQKNKEEEVKEEEKDNGEVSDISKRDNRA